MPPGQSRIVARTFLLASMLLGTFLHPDAAASDFTLEQVMSAPFPSHLTAAPSCDRVAWVFNGQGRTNLWAAEGPGYQARTLTDHDEDDGRHLGGLAFSPDGRMLVYVKGGSKNRAGEYPNPTSDTAGAAQEVWAVPFSGGEPRKLGEGSSPSISPRGSIAAFLLNHQVYQAPLDEAKESGPLFKARGKIGSLAWSPDGSRLAFVSDRDDHSLIGVYDLDQKKITWLCPGVDRDRLPVWSPDGSEIAFLRFPGATADPPRTQEMDLPFSLWIADPGSGNGMSVWSSPDASGGFAQYYPKRPLQWAAGRRLVFYSEHEGWMHLYSLSIADREAVCLTPGEFEAEDCCLTPDRRYAVFSSNQGDIDRRHLWIVPVEGGAPKPLTEGDGIEWSPEAAGGGKDLYFICSTAFQPAAPAVMRLDGRVHRLIAAEAIPEDFPLSRLVKPAQAIFEAPDGCKIHGQLFVPRGAGRDDRRPAVIFMHGGPIRQMLLGWHMRGYYHGAYAMNQYLALRGYVVLSVNFRSGIGYGRAFRRAPDQGPRGAAEYQDIVAAAQYLRGRPDVDPEKIGLWGGSYGGYLTALGLARDSDLFKAGVDFHGVHDWSLRGRRRDGRDWGITDDPLMRVAYEASPVADIRFWHSPVLFIHGDDDRNVDFIQTVDLVQRLRKEGKAPVQTLVFPEEVHGFYRHESWLRAFHATADFFDRHLKK